VRAFRRSPGPTLHRERVPSWLGYAILAMFFGAIAIGVVVARLRLPPPRVLPRAVHPAVLIVPIGEGRPRDLDRYAADYRSEYGLQVQIGDPIPLEPRAYDPGRRQFVAQDLLATLRSYRPAEPGSNRIVVGITSADMYPRDVPWNFAFAWRASDGYAVLSSARIVDHGRFYDRWWTFRKLLTRELGFLCFGLPATTDPYDLLYQDLNSQTDLERMSSHL
jgi:predicted Zn-dependent protease